MKPYIRDGDLGTFVQLDRDHATVNMRHFLNHLNRRVFGNAGRRLGRRVSVVPTLEGTASKHLHYHLVMDCPFLSDDMGLFERTVGEAWASTWWGNREIHVSPADDGWIDYITKLADKPMFADAIDWTNAHLPV